MEGKCECCGRPLCEVVDWFVDEWKKWAKQNENSPEIKAFLDFKPELWIDIGGEG